MRNPPRCHGTHVAHAVYLPRFTGWLTRNFDWISSLTSNCPFLSLSNVSNSASINLIHCCLGILRFWSVSIRSSNYLTSFSPSASLSCFFGTAAFCGHRFLAWLTEPRSSPFSRGASPHSSSLWPSIYRALVRAESQTHPITARTPGITQPRSLGTKIRKFRIKKA